ncbi:hypothetical protein CcaverHIS002_0306220 [Cutaneotrichosporon cavernicola]|uniref:MARVEL domain-containing protein n=1 Tax=Cutaneotrichosporon cavernicola TaxID=279322 RepID=A0AA48L2U0_9TREE|nr:uncharacterized protein CcaverHIS019_0306180 [Cutaneotrichosporon cavernicola]BEI82754.1 hypothetical protein CcaverHIS002_0306220 [Cutaneotrichosporon cavernicola]BEI90548.1 hypothetical protein CcaverHIS019_0306180 [Cutaneotrichosporon cavernicola]BEI98322.1 hypothetical protein CcaverHIS631_0306210 [Cutaneotrichosporon cavernicola]BEJ06098.1 hypothetical protein CcaverHIS641_0306200 [Cutaneotrichosporon cavernicola]
MISASRVHFLLYGVGCFWSLLVWCVAAGLVGKWNSMTYYDSYYRFDSANAVLAWGLLLWLYYTAALAVLMFVSPANPFLSIIADVCILFFFFVFGIGSVGSLSSVAGAFRAYSGYTGVSSFGSLGNATIALGWLLVFIVLGTLIFEVYYTVINYGKDMSVWRQSFHDLTTGGMPRGEKPPAAPPVNVASSSAV